MDEQHPVYEALTRFLRIRPGHELRLQFIEGAERPLHAGVWKRDLGRVGVGEHHNNWIEAIEDALSEAEWD